MKISRSVLAVFSSWFFLFVRLGVLSWFQDSPTKFFQVFTVVGVLGR